MDRIVEMGIKKAAILPEKKSELVKAALKLSREWGSRLQIPKCYE